MRARRIAFAGIAVVAMLSGLWVGDLMLGVTGGSRTVPTIQGAVFGAPRPVPTFELVDHHGNSFTPEQLRDRWTLVFFGYTYCPDVCPTTLSAVGNVHEQLSSAGQDDDVAYVFISVDPARDTRERLAEYTPFFSEKLLGVTGDPQQLLALTRSLGVVYARVGDDVDNYLVDHTSSLLVINPEGQLQAVLSAPHTAKQVITDFNRVRAFHGG